MKIRTARNIGSIDSSESYIAGATVTAGIYREIETGREVVMENEGVLPAALNGRVATYLRRPETWGERDKSRKNEAVEA